MDRTSGLSRVLLMVEVLPQGTSAGRVPLEPNVKWFHYLHPALEEYMLALLTFFKQADVEKYLPENQTQGLHQVLAVAAGYVSTTTRFNFHGDDHCS